MKWEAELTARGFKDLFYTNLSKTGDFKKAYYESENEHEELFDKKKYSDINSFRVSLYRSKKKI